MSGKRGKPPGKKATVNRQFEESEADVRETADLDACPGCGGELSGVTGEYTRRYGRPARSADLDGSRKPA